MQNVSPSPATVLNQTADIEYHAKTALKAVNSMNPKTKIDQANARCIVAQLEYILKLSTELHNQAAKTVNQALQAIADRQV